MALYWRGVRVCACMTAPLNAAGANVTKRCKAQGVPDFYLSPIQGCYSTSTVASAGTHAGGGAIDLNTKPLSAKQKAILEYCMREVGFADWNREPSWWSAWFGKIVKGGWDPHNHGVLNGCVHLSAAAQAQLVEYKNGENGLAGKDRDTGVRSFVGRTWKAYSDIGSGVLAIVNRTIYAPQVRTLQGALHLTQDGVWGPTTDAYLWRAMTMNQRGLEAFKLYNVIYRKAMQRSWGASPVDGLWGPRTKAANVVTVKLIQKALKVTPDGKWGPKTDAAYRALRAKAFKP